MGTRNLDARQALSETVSVTRLPCYAPRRRRAAASWGPGKTEKGRSASWIPDPGLARGSPPERIARLEPTWVTLPAPASRPGRGQAPDPLPGSPGVDAPWRSTSSPRRAGPTKQTERRQRGGGTSGEYACSVSSAPSVSAPRGSDSYSTQRLNSVKLFLSLGADRTWEEILVAHNTSFCPLFGATITLFKIRTKITLLEHFDFSETLL